MSGLSREELEAGPHVIKAGTLTKEGHIFRTWKTRFFTLVRPPSSSRNLTGEQAGERSSQRSLRVESSAQGRGYLRYYAAIGGRKLARRGSSAKTGSFGSELYRFKGEFDLGLAEGDATVRLLPPREVAGKRKHCLQVFRSKTYIKLQASSQEEAEEWAAAIDPTFAFSLQEKRYENAVRFLYKGGSMIRHADDGARQIVVLKLAKDRSRMIVEREGGSGNAQTEITVASMQSVRPGKRSSVQAFDANCLLLECQGGLTENFEASSNASRNEWVDVLDKLIKGMPAHPTASASLYRAGVDDVEAEAFAAQPPPEPEPESDREPGVNEPPSPATQVLHNVKHKCVMKELNIGVPAEDEGSGKDAKDVLSPLSSSRSSSTSGAQKSDRKISNLFGRRRRKSKKNKTKIDAQKLPYGKCVSLAIKRAVGEADGNDASGDIFAAKTYFSMDLGDESTTFEFRSYAGGAFRNMRKNFGVSDAEYVKSLSTLTGGQVGAGKSGMLFFFSSDKRFVLKTVKESEKDFFFHKGILQNYYEHMMSAEDSLICRFYGLYKIKFGSKNSKNPWMVLIVMPNSFETPLVLHEKYDLKGSTRNRYCTPEEAKTTSVLKDLNFKGKMYMDQATRSTFMKQIRHDTEFLIKNMIMDYSLLLGIHRPKDSSASRKLHLLQIASAQEASKKDSMLDASSVAIDRVKSEEDRILLQSGAALGASFATRHAASKWQRDLGGLEARTPDMKPVVYLMSVIDILQFYDRSKRMENMLKRNLHDEKAISAVHPKKYGERFINYLDELVVGIEGVNDIIREEREKIMHELSKESESSAEQEDAGKLQEEIEAAIESALEDKQEENEVVFTSSTEDGIKIELLYDGTQRQVNPDGTRLQKSPEGVLTQWNPDGVVIVEQDGEKTVTHPDGQVDIVMVDGSSETAFPNGSVLQVDADGNRLQRNADGTTIEQPVTGETITRTVDGSSVVLHPDGKRITTMADGTVIEVDTEGTTTQRGQGMTIIKRASGSVLQRNDSGTEIQVRSDGVRVQKTADGITRTTYADGSSHVQGYKDGRTVDTAPDGSSTTSFANGVIVQKSASGDVKQTMPDGTIIKIDAATGKRIQINADGSEVHSN